MKKQNHKFFDYKIIVSVILCVAGIFMLIASMFLPPQGEIHPSIIGAAGEVFTFSGALAGIKVNFDRRVMEYEVQMKQLEEKEKGKEEE